MSSAETRGYVIEGFVGYIRNQLGEDAVLRLPDDLRADVANIKRNEWYPIAHFTASLDLLAEAADGDTELAKTYLMGAAEYMSEQAINTFLKLLIKVMTPRMFAGKLPDFYRHDVRGAGELRVDKLESSRIDVRLEGIGEARHMVPISAGWVASALRATGQSIQHVELRDWSLDNPAPNTGSFTVYWA